MLLKVLKIILDYLITPGGTWGVCLLAGLDWTARAPEKTHQSILFMSLNLLLVAAYASQTGYNGYWKAGRKAYFLIVFILPIIVAMLCMLVGWVSR